MYFAAPYLITLGRVLLALMFIQAGISKIFGYAGTQAVMESHGVPGMLLPLVIFVEAGCGLGVLLGLFTRWSAILLAGFCVLAAFIFHFDMANQHADDQLHEEPHHRRRLSRACRRRPRRARAG